MGKGSSRAGKPSRPYRGGHTGRGGAHEKGGCAVLVIGGALSLLTLGGGAAALLHAVL